MDVDQYFGMCLHIAKQFNISPKEIYETWSLPMMIVTYVDVHNSSVTQHLVEKEYLNSKIKPTLSYKDYIKNITVDMLSEIANESKQENKQFNETHKALLDFYGGNHG